MTPDHDIRLQPLHIHAITIQKIPLAFSLRASQRLTMQSQLGNAGENRCTMHEAGGGTVVVAAASSSLRLA